MKKTATVLIGYLCDSILVYRYRCPYVTNFGLTTAIGSCILLLCSFWINLNCTLLVQLLCPFFLSFPLLFLQPNTANKRSGLDQIFSLIMNP